MNEDTELEEFLTCVVSVLRPEASATLRKHAQDSRAEWEATQKNESSSYDQCPFVQQQNKQVPQEGSLLNLSTGRYVLIRY